MTPDTALLLALSCVAEIDLGPDRIRECRIKWSVNTEQAESRGVSVAEQVSAYDSLLRRGRDGRYIVRTPRAQWVRSLDRSGDKPEGWPENVSWGVNRVWWFAILAAADAFVTTPGPNPCPRADHYGGRCDDKVGACDPPKVCMAQVDCGDTRQAYWSTDACRGTGPATERRNSRRAISAKIASGG